MVGARKRWLWILGALLVLGVALDQVGNYALMSGGVVLGRRIAPFDPPLFNPGQWKAFAKYESFARSGQPPETSFHLDPDLGWAPPADGVLDKQHFNWAGCRVGPEPLEARPRPGVRRIVTLGCSFTLGEEVEDEQAWVWLLDAALDDHEFANLAMSAYGLDQALLRYRRDGRSLAAEEVWLGWLPAASLRLLTVYRGAQRHWTPTPIFKPRLRLSAEGRLELVPCPARTPADAYRLLSSQPAFLEALGTTDHWVARAPLAYAPAGSHWVHDSALGRLGLTLHERRGRDHVAWLRDEESELPRLLLAIVTQLAAETRADGARLRFLVLPQRDDLEQLRANRQPYWNSITTQLQAAGIEVLDCGPALLAAGALEDDGFWAPSNHYSARGNAVVAEHLRSVLRP